MQNKNAPYSHNRVTKLDPKIAGRNYAGEKEIISTYVFITPRLDTPITVRVYAGRSTSASTIYATIWFNNKDWTIQGSGTGTASGYGYHKESAAIDAACTAAGLTFEKHFDGYGDSPTQLALKALARKLGYRRGKLLQL